MSDLNKNSQTLNTDTYLRRFRENVAASIAGVIVVGSVIMFGLSFSQTGNEEQFNRTKDLLLIINPLLGVVLGYYFNKVSTEARAENAEATAQTAVVNAQQAAKAQETAQAEAQEAKTHVEAAQTDLAESKEQVQKVNATLETLSVAAEDMMMKHAPPKPATRSLESAPDPEAQARQKLESALIEAKQVLKE